MSAPSPLLDALSSDLELENGRLKNINAILGELLENEEGDDNAVPAVHHKIVSTLRSCSALLRSEPSRSLIQTRLEAIIHDVDFPILQKWRLLSSAVNFAPQFVKAISAANGSFIIIKAVCSKAPDLAFWCSSERTAERPTFPAELNREDLEDRSPFMGAVSEKKTFLIAEHMIDCIAHESSEIIRDLIWRSDPAYRPLWEAMKNSGMDDIRLLELLLQYDDDIHVQRDLEDYLLSEQFSKSSAKNADRLAVVATSLLGAREHRYELRNYRTFGAALGSVQIVDSGSYDSEMFQLLFTPKIIYDKDHDDSGEMARRLIRLENDAIWQLDGIKESWSTCPAEWDLLHEAVIHAHENLVCHLAERTNWVQLHEHKLRTGQKQLKYALWYASEEYSGKRSSPQSVRTKAWAPQPALTTIQSAPILETTTSTAPIAVERQHSDVGISHSEKTTILQSDCRANMRNAIISKLIQICTPMRIHEIVTESKTSINEISFDLSGFDAHAHNFSDFVEALLDRYPMSRHQNEAAVDAEASLRRHLKFQSTLRYVDIPSIPSQLSDLRVLYFDIDKLLKWLQNKGVKQVIELDVLDRLWGSHTEQQIAYWLDEFKVENANWRYQDLSMHAFNPGVKGRLKSLHLYSSGKQAVESYWFGNEGLWRLPKLKSVEITIIKDLVEDAPMVENRINLLGEEFNQRIGRCNKRIAKHNARVAQNARSKSAQKTTRCEVDFLVYVEAVHIVKPISKDREVLQVSDQVIPELRYFLEKYRQLGNLIETKKKVAVLDNGIMLSALPSSSTAMAPGSDILGRVVAGESFVYNDEGRQSSWIVPSNSHGTQMANLICAIDPLCELYVAKVGEHRHDVNPGAVTKAIRWATEQGVDVISMSFSFYQNDAELEAAIDAAHKKNIVLICSTHDEGRNQHDAYPAKYLSTITIAASEKWGAFVPYTPEKTKYQYRITGVNVFAGKVRFLPSDEFVSGSSAATAIAAGLASLLLHCYDLSGSPKPIGNHSKREIVEVFLQKMTHGSEDSFVDMEIFCDLRTLKKLRPSQREFPDVLAAIGRWFEVSDEQRQNWGLPRTSS